jgi:hypothetical protein
VVALHKDGTPVRSPEERLAAVRPYWQQLTPEQQVSALTVDLAALRHRAEQISASGNVLKGTHQDYSFLEKQQNVQEYVQSGLLPAITNTKCTGGIVGKTTSKVLRGFGTNCNSVVSCIHACYGMPCEAPMSIEH